MLNKLATIFSLYERFYRDYMRVYQKEDEIEYHDCFITTLCFNSGLSGGSQVALLLDCSSKGQEHVEALSTISSLYNVLLSSPVCWCF